MQVTQGPDVSGGLRSLFSSIVLSHRSTEGLSKRGEEEEPNLSRDVPSMARRASERCHFRRSAWLGTLYAKEIRVHPLLSAGWQMKRGLLYVQRGRVHLRKLNSRGSFP